MALTFPSSPSNGQIFTSNNKSWVWNGSSWNGAATSNVNAATLDTLDSTQFLRSDASDTMSGTLTLQGNLKLGTSGDNNYISFYGITGDVPGSYNTTLIGEHLYGGTEQSELLLWKGNDLGTTSGPDRIRLVGADLCFDTYGTTTSGYYTDLSSAGAATTRRIMTMVGSTQNVGIGTVSPAAKLHIDQGTSDTNSFTIRNHEVGANIGAYGTGSSYPREFVINGTRLDGGSSPKLRLAGQGGINFAVDANTIRAVIDTSGNVGIGTVTPSKRLDIRGGDVTIYGGVDGYNANAERVRLYMGNNNAHIGAKYGSGLFFDPGNSAGDAMIIQQATGNIGMGTNSPSYKLHVVGEGYFTDLRVNDDLVFEGNGTSRILGNGQLDIYGTGTGTNIEIGTTASATSYPNSKVLYVLNGNSSEIFTVINSGRVGINDGTPSYTLDVNGTIRATGDVISDSDIRLKSDIKPIKNALLTVQQLNGKTYTKDGLTNQVGLIAQEVESILPDLVHTADDEMKTKSLNYANMVALLVEAVKELTDKVNKLENK